MSPMGLPDHPSTPSIRSLAWHVVQAHAQAHTDAQTATRAEAEKLAARAEAHGQAQAQAVEAAHRLKRVASMGASRLAVAASLIPRPNQQKSDQCSAPQCAKTVGHKARFPLLGPFL